MTDELAYRLWSLRYLPFVLWDMALTVRECWRQRDRAMKNAWHKERTG
jgi:hypothetical protein